MIAWILLFTYFCGVVFAVVEDVDFSVARSFRNKEFSLELSPQDLENVEIKYDIAYGPSDMINLPQSTGTLYKTPILINRTCLVLAYAFNQTFTSINRTVHSYIFVSDVIKQSTWYAPNVAANSVANITIGLLAIPSLSISSTSPYPTEYNNMGTWDYPSSTPRPRWGAVEWVDPNSKDNWRENIEWDIYGGSSRSFPKKSLRIRFRQGNLKFPLFDGFDTNLVEPRYYRSLDLRSHSSDGVFGNLQGRNWGSYLKNVFTDVTAHEAKVHCPHSRNVNLYFNTIYYGFYHVRERFTSNYLPTYFGGSENDYEYRSTERSTGPDVRTESPVYYYEIFPPAKQNFLNIDKWFDWDSFLFFTILEQVGRNYDLSYTHNWVGGGANHSKPWMLNKGGWKFFPNDYDLGYDGNYAGDPVVLAVDNMITSLTAEGHIDFMTKFYDAQWRFMYKPGSPLSVAGANRIFQFIEAREKYEYLMYAETARWGYFDVNFWNKNFANFDMSFWRATRKNVYDSIPYLHNLCRGFYSAKGWLDPVGAITFSLANNQVVTSGSELSITHPSFPVYYTTNGEDPRLSGGGVNPNAKQLNKLTLTQTTYVFARAKGNNNQWGAIDSVLIKVDSVDCPLCQNVLITEIHYEPENEGKSHFIELKNLGNTDLSLTGCVLSLNSKNNFTFPTSVIKSGSFYVLNFYNEDFKKVYTKYGDANIGLLIFPDDDIVLYDALGKVIHKLTFRSKLPWSKCAKGYGYSLVMDKQYYSIAANFSQEISKESVKCWRYSAKIGGSPWEDDSTPTDMNMRQHNLTFSFISFEDNWVSIYNPTNADVDISGWVITDGYIRDSTQDYEIKAGSIVASRKSLQIKIPKKKMELTRKHNNIYLFNLHPVLKVITGNYYEFDSDLFIKSLHSKRDVD